MTKSSMDSEINKFSSIASDWWKKNGKFKVLHNFNKVRVKYIQEILAENNLYNEEILDVGCGGGILSESFAKLGYKVTGIDASDKTINVAKEHAKEHDLDINYYNLYPEDYLAQNPSKKFKIIFAMEIIEHVNNPSLFIDILMQLLAEGGIIFFSTINRNLKSLILAKYTAEYVLNWVPKNTHDHHKFITPAELNELLEDNNSKIHDIKGINLNPLTREWKLVKNPTVNYICCAFKE